MTDAEKLYDAECAILDALDHIAGLARALQKRDTMRALDELDEIAAALRAGVHLDDENLQGQA